MHLLDLVAALRRAMPRTHDFNVFAALGRETDEVFLHSRLIAALIDLSHNRHAEQALGALLRQFAVPLDGDAGFRLNGVQIRTEFQGIDILVTNRTGQALIIENKIYAGDQDKQLRRYYDTIRGQGYRDIYVRYLTLDGHDATPQSLDGLDQELVAPWLANASYATDILLWLEEVAALAVRDSAMRETIFQYQNVIQRLTGQGQERRYMSELINTLMKGNNMVLARDISAAYTQGLIKLQKTFWTELIDVFQTQHSDIYKSLDPDSVANPRSLESAVAKYYEPAKRDKMNYGLRFTVPGYPSTKVCIEIEHTLYFGVHCPDGKTAKGYRRAVQAIHDANITGESHPVWPYWRWIGADYNFMQPDDSLLEMLCTPAQLRAFAMTCAAPVAELWHLLVAEAAWD